MTIANIVCLVLIIVFGILCNAFGLTFILRHDAERTLKDKIIAILCIMNASQSLGYAIELHAAIKNQSTKGFCEAAAFIVCSLTYTSIGYFVALTIERCITITLPFMYVAWFSNNNKTWWLCVPPICGLFLGAAPLFGWGRYGHSRETSSHCSFDFYVGDVESMRSYFLFAVFCSFVIPLIITSVCFTRILIELRRTALEAKRKYGKASNISRASSNSIREQGLSCLLTGFVYVASWVPYTIVCFRFYVNDPVSITFEHAAIYLSKSSTISSPIVYCLIERRFRVFVKEKITRNNSWNLQMTKMKPMLHTDVTNV